jgi:GUN4-like
MHIYKIMFQPRPLVSIFCLCALLLGVQTISLPQVKSETAPVTAVPLPTASTVNLAQLDQALASPNYREASRLTSLLVLDLAGKRAQGFLKVENTRKLACQPLQAIDKSWLTASHGYFGLSVQASIWRGLRGKTYEDSRVFQEIVGWQNNPPIFSTAAPRGHLPFRPTTAAPEGYMDAWGGWWIAAIADRLDTCAKQ